MKARIQRRPDGQLLGAAVFLPAGIIQQSGRGGADAIDYTLKAHPDGILIEMGDRV